MRCSYQQIIGAMLACIQVRDDSLKATLNDQIWIIGNGSF